VVPAGWLTIPSPASGPTGPGQRPHGPRLAAPRGNKICSGRLRPVLPAVSGPLPGPFHGGPRSGGGWELSTCGASGQQVRERLQGMPRARGGPNEFALRAKYARYFAFREATTLPVSPTGGPTSQGGGPALGLVLYRARRVSRARISNGSRLHGARTH
jgi:hypothetical protein